MQEKLFKENESLRQSTCFSSYLANLFSEMRHCLGLPPPTDEDYKAFKDRRPLRRRDQPAFTRIAASGEVTFASLFAVDIFSEIMGVLGPDIGLALEHLVSALKDLNRSVSSVHFESASLEQFKILKKRLGLEIEIWGKAQTSCNLNLVVNEALWMKCNPLAAGIRSRHIQSRAYLLGLEAADYIGSIHSSCMLYEMCRTCGGGESVGRWEDLEWVMDKFGKERFFKGRVPTTLPEFFSTFARVVGRSAIVSVPVEKRRKRKGGVLPDKIICKTRQAILTPNPLLTAFARWSSYTEIVAVKQTDPPMLLDYGIETILHMTMLETVPSGPVPDDYLTMEFVGNLIMTAEEWAGPGNHPAFVKTCGMVNEFIEREGGVECRKLEKRIGGWTRNGQGNTRTEPEP
ncbi:hypothetical protein HDV00_009518 [Rhizophlyctis rosea]|nr:hypothetical protein HDV00_009518 [Rhizophlyctis rosea]